MLGGVNKYHPMSGPWPPPPARELWVEPPSTPAAVTVAEPALVVVSWFDSGVRLAVTGEEAAVAPAAEREGVPADQAAKIAAMKADGAAVVARRLAIAEQMAAPKQSATTTESAEVTSWYDAGVRLGGEAADSVAADSAGNRLAPKILKSLFDIFSKPSGEAKTAPAVSAAKATKATERPISPFKAAIGRVAKVTGLVPAPTFGPPPPGFVWGILYSDDVPATALATSSPATVEEEPAVSAEPEPAAALTAETPAPAPVRPREQGTKKAVPVTIRKADLHLGVPPTGFYWGGIY